jgi:hypothetical protein
LPEGDIVVAGLLFVIGLVSVLASLGLVGLAASGLLARFNAAMADNADLLATVLSLGRDLQWAVTPIVGGLLLMAVARIIVLLAAINRSLRGNA